MLRRAAAAALLFATTALAQSALSPLSFLAGRWTDVTASQTQEEIWSPPIGGSMTGSFRIVEQGKPVFYEAWAIELDDNKPVMRLRHFNAGFTSWEDKATSVAMPLVSSAANDAVFTQQDGSVSLHYHRDGNTLTCVVRHVKNGKSSDESFTLKRAD